MLSSARSPEAFIFKGIQDLLFHFLLVAYTRKTSD